MVTVLGERGYLGAIVKRRWQELGDSDHVVNCIRPDDLIVTMYYRGRGLIQPSTDAIAESTPYAELKRGVETLARGAVIIRAGIVDIRQDYPTAYRNWLCNPLTPLEWADFAWEHRDEPGLHITGREPLSRYNVAVMVADVFDRPMPKSDWADSHNDRVQAVGDFPPLHDALLEFREWLQS